MKQDCNNADFYVTIAQYFEYQPKKLQQIVFSDEHLIKFSTGPTSLEKYINVHLMEQQKKYLSTERTFQN